MNDPQMDGRADMKEKGVGGNRDVFIFFSVESRLKHFISLSKITWPSR